MDNDLSLIMIEKIEEVMGLGMANRCRSMSKWTLPERYKWTPLIKSVRGSGDEEIDDEIYKYVLRMSLLETNNGGSSASERGHHGRGVSTLAAKKPEAFVPKGRAGKCSACFENATVNRAPCGCLFCADCIAAIFIQALGDDDYFMQPQCCGEPLPMDMAAPILKEAGIGVHTETPATGLDQATTYGNGKRNTGKAKATGGKTVDCLVCMESVNENDAIKTPCQHSYCRGCMKQLFMEATRNEALYPPKCCDRDIPITVANVVLSPQQQTEFTSKGREFKTKDRVYCSTKRCSAFIPPNRIKADVATCTRCARQTCIHCKAPYHRGECPNDKETQAVLRAATKAGWRRCYSCKVLVAVDEGCNHITCLYVSL